MPRRSRDERSRIPSAHSRRYPGSALPYDHVAVPNPDRQAVWHLRIGLKAFPGLSSWSSGADPGRSPLYDADPEVNCCAIAIGVVVSVVLL